MEDGVTAVLTYKCCIISCHEPYSSRSFWLFGECPECPECSDYLEKWQLANEFSVSKVNCDGNTLLPAKKEWKISFKINNALVKNFALVN